MTFYKYQNLLIQKDDVDVDTKEYWSDYWQNNSDDRKDIFIEFNDAFNKLLYPENVLEKKDRKNIKILEIGCGDGRYVKELIKQGYDAVGIDIVREGMIKNNDLEFVQGDIEYLPFKDNSFDVCVLIGILGYFINPSKLLIEANRVLKCFGFALLRFSYLTLNKRVSQYSDNENKPIILHDGPKGVFTCYHNITAILGFVSNLNWELFCLTPDINSQFIGSIVENNNGEQMIITDYDDVAMSFRKLIHFLW